MATLELEVFTLTAKRDQLLQSNVFFTASVVKTSGDEAINSNKQRGRFVVAQTAEMFIYVRKFIVREISMNSALQFPVLTMPLNKMEWTVLYSSNEFSVVTKHNSFIIFHLSCNMQ